MKNITVHCVTWNVGDQKSSSDDFSMLLGVDKKPLPDIICIGLQEVVEDSSWTTDFNLILSPHDYILMKVRSMWAIWTYVYVQRSHIYYVTNIESETTASGFAGVMANKGGVTVRMDIYGINFAVVCAHFTAHAENNKERLNDYVDIISSQKFRDPDVENILDHDYVIWMGDLNFRLEDCSKEAVEKHIAKKEFNKLWPLDQLNRSRKEELIFDGFQEGPLNFPPTFKFDVGSSVYDTSKKQRVPSWTDRILYMVQQDLPHRADRSKQVLKMTLNRYISLPSYLYSDHRPVVANLSVAVMDAGPPLSIHFDLPIGDVRDKHAASHKKVEWSSQQDGPFKYHWVRDRDVKFKPDTRDWIGIFPTDYIDVNSEYLGYTHANTSSEEKLMKGVEDRIDKKHLDNLGGKEVQLVYFSKRNNCPVGYSRPIKIANDGIQTLGDMLGRSKIGVVGMSKIMSSSSDHINESK